MESLFFCFVFILFFFPLLDFKSWHGFNPYQYFFLSFFSFLPFFFPSFALFPPPFFPLLFFPSSNSFLPLSPVFLPFFFLLFFSHSFSSSCFLFSSPFCCFSVSLSSFYFVISSSFSLPHCFYFCLFFLAFKFLSCYTSLPRRLL